MNSIKMTPARWPRKVSEWRGFYMLNLLRVFRYPPKNPFKLNFATCCSTYFRELQKGGLGRL